MTRSPLDLAGGADPSLDEITATAPAEPSFREGASIWVWDDDGRLHFPRIGIEAVGATWSTSFESALCAATPDGDLLLAFDDALPHAVHDADGRPRVLGAGDLRMECNEPFERWRVTFDGRALATGPAAYLAGGVPKPKVGPGDDAVALRLELEARMVAPPWFQGTHEPLGVQVAGERRFEQLGAVTGVVAVDGDERPFRGGCLRVHRTGGDRNDYGEFHGHCWQSAVFPSGRGFGVIHYRPGPDGVERYREGWVATAGEVRPARVERTPWMDDVRFDGEDVSLMLRADGGEHVIGGVTVASSIRPPRPTASDTTFPVLHSAIARYRWGGEEAFGMVERSSRIDLRVTPD